MMAIRSLRDINAALLAGRFHQQRIYKVNTDTANGVWKDWAYGSGQPGYDARVGVSGAFNPYVAARNDAIFFPGIAAGMDRHLAGVEINILPNGDQSNLAVVEMYDLLGVIPLVDGDSADQQTFDSSQALPRYADGDGVQVAFVNHVAPMLSAADGVMEYVDCEGATRTTDFRVYLGATGRNVTSTYRSGGSGGAGTLYAQLASGCRGVRMVNSVQFMTPPGGLFSIYLCKPLLGVQFYSAYTTGSNQHAFASKCNCLGNAFNMPRIYDGAHLGLWYMTNGTQSRAQTFFGHVNFVWG
jgi:hypothetical protein